MFSSQHVYSQEVDKGVSNKKKLRQTRYKTRNKQGDKSHKGDITGRKKKTKRTKRRTKANSSISQPYSNSRYKKSNRNDEGKNVKRADGRYNIPSKRRERGHKGDISGRKIKNSTTRTGEERPVTPARNPYAGRKRISETKKGRKSRRYAGRAAISASQGGEDKPKKRRRIRPRSASRAFIKRGKVNVYAGKARIGERAHRKDIAGRKIRRKGFTTKRRKIVKPPKTRSFANKRKGEKGHKPLRGSGYASISKKGEKKYKGSATGGYVSATKKGEKGWKNDITGRKFKSPADPGIVKRKRGVSYTGNRERQLSISGALKNNDRKSINIAGGGGSISGKNKRGGRQPLPRKSNFNADVGGFAGNMLGNRKPLKGGGSITGKLKRRNRKPLPRKSFFNADVGGFAGNMLGKRKPLKGGGSISGKRRNNKGLPLRRKGLGDTGMSFFQGNLKGYKKPLKGGGSISGAHWNNKGNPIQKKGLGDTGISLFQGKLKGYKKPLKGGGSISGTHWNNKGNPIQKKGLGDTGISLFQGNLKRYKKPLKGGGSITSSGWNNKGKPLIHKYTQDKVSANFKGRTKIGRRYVQNVKASKKSIKKRNLREGVYFFPRIATFEGHTKQKDKHKKNQHAHDKALKGKVPLPSAYKAMAYKGKFRSKKTFKRGMHPSAKYTTSIHPRNANKEKQKIFKFNIWWAKLFKKNENQPTSVKEKKRTPRYDKREKDLWYD